MNDILPFITIVGLAYVSILIRMVGAPLITQKWDIIWTVTVSILSLASVLLGLYYAIGWYVFVMLPMIPVMVKLASLGSNLYRSYSKQQQQADDNTPEFNTESPIRRGDNRGYLDDD